jgi:hypothetical protein
LSRYIENVVNHFKRNEIFQEIRILSFWDIVPSRFKCLFFSLYDSPNSRINLINEIVMTIITLGTGTSAPSTINELTKLILWNALKIREMQPKEAENPDSIVFKTLDVIDRKIKGGNQYKLGNETKTRSSGGVEISPEVLPFPGGQTANTYVVKVGVEVINYRVSDGFDDGRSTGQTAVYVDGPIGSISIKSDGPGTYFYLAVKGRGGTLAKGYLGWGDISNLGYRHVNTIKWREITRIDGTSVQNDIVQGGNPNPDQVGTSEPRTTTNITNNTTNNTTNVTNNYPYPPPFADPPPQSWPPPPAIKPAPSPNPNPSPSPTPNPISGPITNGKPNIAPGSYPAPAPSSPTTLGPTTRISSGTASGSSGPSGEGLASPNAPAPFAEPPEPGKFTALPIPVPAPATSGSSSPASNLTPVNNGQVVNAPETERERQGLPVPESGGSCCALPAIQSGNNEILGRLNGLNNAAQDALLLEVLNRLGPQVAGGLSGWLGRFSRSIKLDRVLNVLQFMLVLHNAGMLSRSLVDSISYLIDSAGQAFGLKDEDDNPLDLTAIIGKSISSFLEQSLGTELYSGLSYNWKKLSAIYTAATNIYQLMTDNMAGISQGLTTVGNYTGKIGNALKRGGVIMDNAYDWLNENMSFQSGKFAVVQKVIDGIQNADEVVQDLTSVTDEIINVKENINQIKGEFKTIQDNLDDKEKDKQDKEKEARDNSKAPEIERENKLEAPIEDDTTN